MKSHKIASELRNLSGRLQYLGEAGILTEVEGDHLEELVLELAEEIRRITDSTKWRRYLVESKVVA